MLRGYYEPRNQESHIRLVGGDVQDQVKARAGFVERTEPSSITDAIRLAVPRS
eukprot:SAG11_NODE_30511_length_300_cov_0.776119_1_plen_52_part_10